MSCYRAGALERGMSRQRINGELHRARAQVKALRRRPKVTGTAEIASDLEVGSAQQAIASFAGRERVG